MATSTIKNITPENIGAVSKAGDTMTGALQLHGCDIVIKNSVWQWIWFCDLDGKRIAAVRGDKNIGNRVVFRNQTPNASSNDACEDYVLPAPTADSYKSYDILTTKSPVTVEQGGTGVKQGTIDITDFCIFPNANKFVLAGSDSGRLYYNPYLNCVFGTLQVAPNTIVDNQEVLVYLRKDASGTVLKANRPAACGGCIHNYQVTMTAMPRIEGDVIRSSHQLNTSITSPVYTIMAFLG